MPRGAPANLKKLFACVSARPARYHPKRLPILARRLASILLGREPEPEPDLVEADLAGPDE